jgi:hypothetical protein
MTTEKGSEMQTAQRKTIGRLRDTFKFLDEPRQDNSGNLVLTYLASDNAGLPISIRVTIAGDGTYTGKRA